MQCRLTSLALVVAALSACAAGPAPRSGFLGDYSRLEKVGSSDSLLEQRPPPEYDFSRFRAVMIEPTEIRIDNLDDDEKRKLSDAFRDALVEQIGGALPIVDRSGPDVIKIRTAIVDARKANVAVNAVTSLLLMPVSRGGMAAEAEVVDGGSNRRIAALAWARRGAKLTEVGLSYTQLGEARSGLRAFARRLADLFTSENAQPAEQDRRASGHRAGSGRRSIAED